jgi:hypothetical protein
MDDNWDFHFIKDFQRLMNQTVLVKVNTETEKDDMKVDELKLFQNI